MNIKYLKLKEIRENKGFSQNQLAYEMGITCGIISRYESGENTPSLKRLIQIACVLDCKLDDLIDLKAIKKQYAAEQKKIDEDVKKAWKIWHDYLNDLDTKANSKKGEN